MNIKVAWDMTPCQLQAYYPEDGKSKLLQKVSNYLIVYTNVTSQVTFILLSSSFLNSQISACLLTEDPVPRQSVTLIVQTESILKIVNVKI